MNIESLMFFMSLVLIPSIIFTLSLILLSGTSQALGIISALAWGTATLRSLDGGINPGRHP